MTETMAERDEREAKDHWLQLAQELASEHWAWLGPILEKQYKDAFIHGFKHGVEALEELI